jgi:DNA-binding CsgD family transcriptional regulator
MSATYPIVLIYNHSRMTSELLQSFITLHCNKHCVFVKDLLDVQLRRNTVFVLCDWQNFVDGKVLQTTSDSLDSQIDEVNILYVIRNIVRGEERQLVKSQHLQKIRGIFYFDDDLETFRRGFTAILNNEIWVPRTVLMTWMNTPGRKPTERFQEVLSLREVSVLQLIAGGRSNKEISQELYISANTVKAHLYNIYKKIDVANRLQAAIWASHHINGEQGTRQLNNRNSLKEAPTII